MKTLGNVLWLVLAGFWLALGYIVAGILNCLLITTIPFGIQSFKLAGYALWPFGRMVVERPDRDVALGLPWKRDLVRDGWDLVALAHLIAGLLLCATVIGIPLRVASFKLAGLALAPFGKQIVPCDRLGTGTPAYSPPPTLRS